jgi:HEAT repeat protein
MQDLEMKNMLIEYMGKGFLENIISLFRQDRSLYQFLPDMLGEENMRVRLGATALLEELAGEHQEDMRTALPGIIGLLQHANATIRGDAAFALGIIKDPGAIDALRICLADNNPGVREIVRGVLEDILGSV